MRSYKSIKRLLGFSLSLLGCTLIVLFALSQLRLCKTSDRKMYSYELSFDNKKQITELVTPLETSIDIVNVCSELTTDLLSFSKRNDISNGKANCVGYARLTTAIINYAFQIKKLPCQAKHVVGKVYLFEIDLNNVAQGILPEEYRPFFKDHDFVEVDLGDATVYVDSSLCDLTGMRFVQY